ncbi:Hypothetical protein GLP15_2714 [Giardia lamblia P15]|uniref:Uncharacterized protein n=1 Tax=Giardia intestinalis (strain P15) TaxID=658858 RepID=E1F8W8_GIAIA|nr:Hypothetical protein GLP15_2714 [Giardia lamblia P15]
MEPRYSCFIKTGVCSASMLETGSSVESFLITTAAGTLSILTLDSSGSYRSKPLEFDPQKVVAVTPALKPNSTFLDLAFSASSSGVMSINLSEDCLYTVNDMVCDATLLSAVSMCRLTTAERYFVSTLRKNKSNIAYVIPPLVLLAQQCNVLAYRIPTTASLTQNQTEAFWVPTGDVVVHMATFLPLASRLKMSESSSEIGETELDYFVISRDRYGRYFRGEELLAEKRLPAHVLRMKTLGRFILLLLTDHSLYLLYLSELSILQLHRFPSDRSLIDACLLEKPPSNILLEKRPLSTSTSFKAFEAKTVEESFGLNSITTSAGKDASGSAADGIPLIVKLHLTKITFSVLTFHPTAVDRGMPSVMELPIHEFPIALPVTETALSTNSVSCTIDSGTLSALPDKSLLWIIANDTILTFSVKVFVDIYSMLLAYNFRGHICNSNHDFSQSNDVHDVMHLLAKKRTLTVQLQLLQQQQMSNSTHDSCTDTDKDQRNDSSREYTFGDLLREARLLGIYCTDVESRSMLPSLKCFPGHYLIKIALPEQLFVHSLAMLDPSTGAVKSVSVPLNIKDASSEFRKICCGSEDSSLAASLGSIVRDHSLHLSTQFLDMEQQIQHVLLFNGHDHAVDVVNDMTVMEMEKARNIFLSELTRTHLSEKCTKLLPSSHHISHHPNKNAQPESVVEVPISSHIIEEYAGSTLVLQLSVTQTNLCSATHGISIPIPISLPVCPMMRLCSSSSVNTLASFEGGSLATLLEEAASLTMSFNNYKILDTKLEDILCKQLLIALSDDHDPLAVKLEQSNEFVFFVENCSSTDLLRFLSEVSDDDLPLPKLLGYSVESKLLDLLTKSRLGTVFRVHCFFENLQLTKVRLSGLDTTLLISFAQKLVTVLLPNGADVTLFREVCSSLRFNHKARSFLTAIRSVHRNFQNQLGHVSAGLSELSAHMLLDCDQTLDLASMCLYRRASDQLQNLKNSIRITIKQALDAQETNKAFGYCQAYLDSLESSLLFINNSKADDIKAWMNSDSSPATLEWGE